MPPALDDRWPDLVPLVYDDLHRIAERHMRRERSDHTLQPTALLNEAFVRLVEGSGVDVRDRGHFLNLASRVMRQVLVDHARQRAAAKRDGGIRTTLPDEVAAGPGIDVLQVDGLLERLGTLDPEQARIVELRFFGGLTVAETAETLGVSARTIDREWRLAKAWLRTEIEAER